jgi:hypothetical protein
MTDGVMTKELDAFAAAIGIAERHRTILRTRFGLSDRQIGAMVIARRPRKTMSDFAAAVVAAKTKLEARRAQQHI